MDLLFLQSMGMGLGKATLGVAKQQNLFLFRLLIIVIVLFLFFLVVFWMIKGGKKKETALDILKKRYAKGEITEKEFYKIKKEIE
jgi:putative membrane protein